MSPEFVVTLGRHFDMILLLYFKIIYRVSRNQNVAVHEMWYTIADNQSING